MRDYFWSAGTSVACGSSEAFAELGKLHANPM